MKFGTLGIPPKRNLKLPEDHPENQKLLTGKRAKNPKIFVGFPIWSHPKWNGTIYPKGTKPAKMLQEYAKQYNCIEVNATHYKMPSVNQVLEWKSNVPEDFHFCIKVPHFIGHAKELPAKFESMQTFINNLSHFGKKLGCSFLLLPDKFSTDKQQSLIEFIKILPKGFQLAIELRHESWFLPNALDEVVKLMNRKKLPLIITDTPARRDVLHQRLTSKTVFVRFSGLDMQRSDTKRLDQWSERISYWLHNGIEKVYFMVHTEPKEWNPNQALYFIKKLNEKGAVNVALPTAYQPKIR